MKIPRILLHHSNGNFSDTPKPVNNGFSRDDYRAAA